MDTFGDFMTDQAVKKDAEIRKLCQQRDELLTALKATKGYLMNAKIDLETNAPKKTAINTIDGGLQLVDAAIAKATGP
jgi:hypothetical protein